MYNTLTTFVKESLQMHYQVAVRRFHALTDVLRVVSVLWL